MPYSIDSSSDRCYPGTSCLINKFDIHDAQKLRQHLDLAAMNPDELMIASMVRCRCRKWIQALECTCFKFPAIFDCCDTVFALGFLS